MSDKTAPPSRRFWSGARRLFRWCRITVWLILLALLVLALWLNHFGLPAFARERLVLELRLRGVDLHFTRMRLAWYRGIVADNIQFGRAGETNGLRASATEAEVHVRLRALLHRQIDLKGVALRGGRVIIPVWGTNDQVRDLAVEKVSGELRFHAHDEWELDNLQAEILGVKLRLAGTITNATALGRLKPDWKKPQTKSEQAFWHDLVAQFEQTKFAPDSEISGTIFGDARHFETFRASLKIRSATVDSPWGRGQQLLLLAQLAPEPGALLRAAIKLQARNPETPWGRAESVRLEAQLAPSLTQWTPTNAHLQLEVKRARTPWADASALTLVADFRPNPSDPATALADYAMRGQQIQSRWARFAQAELSASGVVSASNAWPSSAKTKLTFAGGEIEAGRAAAGTVEATLTLPPWAALEFTNTNLSWWTRHDRMAGDLSVQLTGVHTPEVDVASVSLGAVWQPPLLTVRAWQATIYDGTLSGAARLDTATRQLAMELNVDVDPQRAAPLFATNVQAWLGQFTWEKPPHFTAAAVLTLPPWTNTAAWRTVDWRKEVVPTLGLSGHFAVGPSTFRTVGVNSLQSDFAYTNRIWRLPHLVLTRPEGRATVAHRTHEDTQQFEFVIDSTLDPRIVRTFFDPAVQEVIDDFAITTPPVIHAEVAGLWNAPEKISARADFKGTNLSYKTKSVLSCNTLVTFTNLVLGLMQPVVVRREGLSRGDSVIIDIPQLKLYINNATGVLELAALTHMISPTVERVMAPYHFLTAPRALCTGVVDLDDALGSNLRFDLLEGGPFEWRSFRFQQVTGFVHWTGPGLLLSNVVGTMHGGTTEMSGAFDFTAKPGTEFGFTARVRDLNLHSLMTDLGGGTNSIEGTLGGLLVITKANTDATNSWFGYGHTTLEDGLIWDVPVLKLFSPLLNAIKPGAGNNRAREATASFIITNSVIATDDLLIHASGMRLNYDGTIDFDSRINGRMEAQLLRDMPGLGPLVSTVFWPVTKLFEYKVTGTLSQPKSQPLFIPKIFMMPLHPLRTIRELLESDKEEKPGVGGQ